MELRRLQKKDLRVGAPIAWPLFDEAAQMVVLPGFVPRSEEQRTMLADFGLYRSDEVRADPELARQAARDPEDGAATPNPVPEKEPTFAEAGFPVGATFSLALAQDLQKRRHAVKLMGWSEGDSLLVTHPRTEDHLLAIREGMPVQIRAAHDRWTCTFDSTVLRVQLQPFPYLHLGYPARARLTQVRGSSRVKMGTVASVGARGHPHRHACTLRDLSLGGMLIQARDRIVEPGEPVDVYFRLQFDGERHVYELTGHVRNVSAANDAGGEAWNHGIELDPIPEAQRRTLKLYLYTRLLGLR